MEIISQQKIDSDVAFKKNCRPELERVKSNKKNAKTLGLPWKLQVCQTTPVCTLLIFSFIGSQTTIYHI